MERYFLRHIKFTISRAVCYQVHAEGQLHAPGTLIWLPEGSRMQFIAEKEPCSCLLVTNA